MTPQLQSHIAGRWIGTQPAQALKSAIDGSTVAHTHADAIDFAQALDYARRVGLPAMLKTDFQQRAGMLKALAKFLGERKVCWRNSRPPFWPACPASASRPRPPAS